MKDEIKRYMFDGSDNFEVEKMNRDESRWMGSVPMIGDDYRFAFDFGATRIVLTPRELWEVVEKSRRRGIPQPITLKLNIDLRDILKLLNVTIS